MATEAKEGILIPVSGSLARSVISLSEVEVLDMLSQGPISGIVDREYTFNGTSGNTGWDSYTEQVFSDPPSGAGAKWLRSVYWNGVPVINSENQYNFQRIDMSYTVGLANGALLYSNAPELMVSRSINERLRATKLYTANNIEAPVGYDKDFTKYYRIYNTDCKAVIVNIKIPRISKTQESDGQIIVTSVDYKIYYKPIFNDADKVFSSSSFNPDGYSAPIPERITGKLSGPYIRATRVNLPDGPKLEKDFVGWEIKIVRVTPESTTFYVQNQTYVDSLTEVYSDTFCYPNVAIVRQKFSAEFFSQIPERAFDVRLLKVKVPKNYDPVLKRYATSGPGTTNGFWNGEFADDLQWTDNPAWCFYDLITNKRYGLGQYIDSDNVDKISLYKIGQYCDVLVPDGYGKLEPRFSCNLIIYSREEAYKVLNDMSSIFNGMAYYANGLVYVSQDSKKNCVTHFTNENVEDGNFTYIGTSKKGRNTVAVVRYNDPKDFYKPAIEYVKDTDGIRKYGIRETEVAAFGCTSRGQATRLGLWLLNSQLRETETVSFTTGLEGAYLRPGDIIGIYDKNRKQYRNAGRIISINSSLTEIVLDGLITINTGKTYIFSLITPSFNYDSSQTEDLNSGDYDNIRKSFIQEREFSSLNVTTNSNGNSVITFSSAFNSDGYIVDKNSVWTLAQKEDSDDNIIDTQEEFDKSLDKDYDFYRVVRITEKEGKYQVGGVAYYEDKFAAIDNGLAYERPVETINSVPNAPSAIYLPVYTVTNNSKYIKCVISSPQIRTGITSYKVFIRYNAAFSSGDIPDLSYLHETVEALTESSSTYYPKQNGQYYFRAYGYNNETRTYSSTYIEASVGIYDLNPIKDVTIGTLTANNYTGVVSSNSYNVQSLYVGEISPSFTWQGGLNQDAQPPSTIYYRATYRPASSSSSTPSNEIYYEQTGLLEPKTTFDFDINSSLSGGPYKSYEIVIEAHDENFITSAGNVMSSSNTTLKENGWSLYPQGFSRILVSGQTAPALSLSTSTGSTFGLLGDSGKSLQYIDLNGGVVYLFGGNTVPSGIVGGYIYASTGYFSGQNVIQSRPDIVSRGFIYNSFERYAYAPAIFSPFTNYNTGWTAISLFDNFDYQYLLKNPNYRTGLPISNTVPIFATGLANTLEIKNNLSFVNKNQFTDIINMRVDNVTGGSGSYRMVVNQVGKGDMILFSRK